MTKSESIDVEAMNELSFENEISREKYIEEALRIEKAVTPRSESGIISNVEKTLIPLQRKRQIKMDELKKARDVVLTLKPYLGEFDVVSLVVMVDV